MKKNSLIVIFLIVLVIKGFAQDSQNENSYSSKTLFSAGIQISDFAEFNNVIELNGLQKLNPVSFSFSLGEVNLHPKKRIVLMESFIVNFQSVQNNTKSSRYFGGGINGGVGYSVILNRKLKFIPFAAFGVSTFQLTSFSIVPNGTSFNNYYSSGANSFKVNGTNFIGEIGILGFINIPIDSDDIL